MLGLHVSSNGEKLCWRRGGDALVVPTVITHQSTFSVCGKQVGHFPICGWFRVAVAAIKHRATSASLGWDNEVRDATLRSMLTKTMVRVTQDDPVRGDWCIKEYNLVVDVALIRSATNKVDALTWVLQRWLTSAQKGFKPLQ